MLIEACALNASRIGIIKPCNRTQTHYMKPQANKILDSDVLRLINSLLEIPLPRRINFSYPPKTTFNNWPKPHVPLEEDYPRPHHKECNNEKRANEPSPIWGKGKNSLGSAEY